MTFPTCGRDSNSKETSHLYDADCEQKYHVSPVFRFPQPPLIDLREVERRKYFRLADRVNLSDVLLAVGLARPYDGGGTRARYL